MRQLTVKRRKTFVASLVKIKVYISDLSGDVTINGVNCRKLGEIANGSEESFEIGEEAARIYVIADKLSKNYSNEYIDIPAGTEDVRLEGINKFNPVAGNPFRFDGNESADIKSHRRKGLRAGIIVTVIALAAGLLVGRLVGGALFSGHKASPKTFTAENMSLTLTDEFEEEEMEGYDFVFTSDKAAVFIVNERFADFDGLSDVTIDEYAGYVIEGNGVDASEVEKIGDVRRFSYTYPVDNKVEYTYTVYIFKSDLSFHIVNFACKTDDYDKYSERIAEWADSVTFKNAK